VQARTCRPALAVIYDLGAPCFRHTARVGREAGAITFNFVNARAVGWPRSRPASATDDEQVALSASSTRTVEEHFHAVIVVSGMAAGFSKADALRFGPTRRSSTHCISA